MDNWGHWIKFDQKGQNLHTLPIWLKMDKKYKNDKSKMRKFEKNGQFEKKMDNLKIWTIRINGR